MVASDVGEDISIHLELTPALWQTKADVGQLEQVLMNLVVNARESMPHGGRIVLTTTNVVFDGRDLLIRSEMRTGRFICCSVTDTGAGIPPEVMAHVFEPFFTTKGNERGTGLGLAVVHGIVSQHEGWIHVYSTPGTGSEFKLYLPAVQSPEPALAAASLAEESPKGAGQRILHVEDDRDVRNVTCRNLLGYGYQVVGSGSVAEARAIFAREKGAFDLVFSDVVLPDGNGVDLVGELVRQQPSLRVLVTSGYTDDKARWPEIQRRGWRFLSKPYPFTELLHALHDELAGKKGTPPVSG